MGMLGDGRTKRERLRDEFYEDKSLFGLKGAGDRWSELESFYERLSEDDEDIDISLNELERRYEDKFGE
jgi:hypothetical protein